MGIIAWELDCNTSELNLNDQVLSDTDFAAINEDHSFLGYMVYQGLI